MDTLCQAMKGGEEPLSSGLECWGAVIGALGLDLDLDLQSKTAFNLRNPRQSVHGIIRGLRVGRA